MYTYTCVWGLQDLAPGCLQDASDDDVSPTEQTNLRASQRVSNKGRKGRPRKNVTGDAPKSKSKARSKKSKVSPEPKAKSRGRPPKVAKSAPKPRVRGGKKGKSGDDVKDHSAGSCPDPITPTEPAPKRRPRTKSVARSPPQNEGADSDGRTFGCGRCRGTKTGCATCRNPDYRPRKKSS